MRSSGSAPGPGSRRAASASPVKRGAELRHRAEQPLRVGMARRAEQLRATGASSTLRPGVHHHDPLGHLGDDAEVVGDQHDRGADLGASGPASGRGSAPGWSRRARSSARRRSAASGCRRAPWRSSRAGACRPRAGADTREARRCASGMPTRLQHLDGAVLGRRAGSRPWCSRSVSRDLPADVSTGLRLVIGSWKIMRDLVAAHLAHLALGAAPAGRVPWKRMRAGDLAGRLGDQAQDRVGGDGLAAAALADHRQRLARLDVEGDAVDGAVDAVRGAEMGLQVLDLEQRPSALQPLGHARIERVAQAVAEQVHREHGHATGRSPGRRRCRASPARARGPRP